MHQYFEKMEASSSHKKNKALDAVVAAINLAAMGAAVTATSRNSDVPSIEAERVERKINELSAKLDRIAEQLKNLQVPSQDQKVLVASGNTAEADKKPEATQQQQQAKPQDVIYVRKSSEFQFYS